MIAIEGQSVPVTLLIAQRFPLLSLAICTESLRLANRELGRAAFTRTIVTVDGRPALSSSGIEIAATAALEDLTFAPAVIILTSYEPERACTPALLSWLRRQDRQGAVIGCVDTGGYLLAKAGVLRGRHIAVHHESLPAYEEIFGGAVLLDRMHTFEDRIASSGGGMATLDMMLALIGRFEDEALAERIAHVLNYRRLPATAGAMDPAGDGALVRADRRLGRMVELMQSHLEAPLPLAALCRMAYVVPSTARRLFLRRFQQTPQGFYLSLRLNRARALLVNSTLSIREIATITGFGDASAFARSFKRRFGQPPSASRRPVSGDTP